MCWCGRARCSSTLQGEQPVPQQHPAPCRDPARFAAASPNHHRGGFKMQAVTPVPEPPQRGDAWDPVPYQLRAALQPSTGTGGG